MTKKEKPNINADYESWLGNFLNNLPPFDSDVDTLVNYVKKNGTGLIEGKEFKLDDENLNKFV